MIASERGGELTGEFATLPNLDLSQLRSRWAVTYGRTAPARLSHQLLVSGLAYKLQEKAIGGLSATDRKFLSSTAVSMKPSVPPMRLKTGTVLLREWQGTTYEITVMQAGFLYREKQYSSLTALAKLITGVHRSGPKFFGILDHAKR